MAFTGKLNIYTCNTCKKHIVTRDIDEGVTPFMLKCRVDDNCKGYMKSSMYRVYDQSMKEDYEWYKPNNPKLLTASERNHAEKGGLLLRKAK